MVILKKYESNMFVKIKQCVETSMKMAEWSNGQQITWQKLSESTLSELCKLVKRFQQSLRHLVKKKVANFQLRVLKMPM